MEKLVYSAQEVAELLGLSKSYVYELMKTKKIPVINLGKKKIIPKETLERWVLENTECCK